MEHSSTELKNSSEMERNYNTYQQVNATGSIAVEQYLPLFQ